MNLSEIETEILKNARLDGGENHILRQEALAGEPRRYVRAIAPQAGTKTLVPAAGNSRLVIIGHAPDGFGQIFQWDRSTPAVLMVLFVNAANPNGIAIDGLKSGDRLTILAASGLASFAKDKGDPKWGGIVALLAAGGKAVLKKTDNPEFVPVVDAGNAFAQQYFKAPTGTDAEIKVRDAFGVDPGSGHKARAEGGVIVCMPQQFGAAYSGDEDHEDRWIKKPGDRYDSNRPRQALGSFFIRQGAPSGNARICTADGRAFVLAWDAKFPDNKGFYTVFLGIEQGSSITPDPGPE